MRIKAAEVKKGLEVCAQESWEAAAGGGEHWPCRPGVQGAVRAGEAWHSQCQAGETLLHIEVPLRVCASPAGKQKGQVSHPAPGGCF